MMKWFCVPPRCVVCHSAAKVVPAVRIWHGAVVRCWRCETCKRDWPLSQNKPPTADRRIGPIDQRRATRADRRIRQPDDSQGTADLCPLCPRCGSVKTAPTLKTGFGTYCRCHTCGHMWHEEQLPPPDS